MTAVLDRPTMATQIGTEGEGKARGFSLNIPPAPPAMVTAHFTVTNFDGTVRSETGPRSFKSGTTVGEAIASVIAEPRMPTIAEGGIRVNDQVATQDVMARPLTSTDRVLLPDP